MGFRRLFLDIETSPNVGYFWQAGFRLTIPYQNITKERGIICVGYKWADHKDVQAITWNRGDDAPMLRKLAAILDQADEVVTHNGDRFDIPHIRTRALAHGVRINDGFASCDTLKIARNKYKFNSNRLDYLAKFLGFGSKIKTEFGLWDKVVRGDKKALEDMVTYCKQDVLLLERVHGRLMEFAKPPTHVGVATGGDRLSCPYCGSVNCKVQQTRVTAAGVTRRKMECRSCGHFFTVADGVYRAVLKAREMLAKKEAKLLADLAALRGGLNENTRR